MNGIYALPLLRVPSHHASLLHNRPQLSRIKYISINVVCALACAFCLAGIARADDSPPTTESIQHLMEVMHSKDMIVDMKTQVESMMQSRLLQTQLGRSITPAQQQAINDYQKKFTDLLFSELTWEKLGPQMYKIYAETYTQDEVNDMTVFYGTPTGQSVLRKMPVTYRQSMTYVQTVIARLAPQMQALQLELMENMKAQVKKSAMPDRI